MLRLPDMPLHDPYIVADRASRTYYLYTSNVGSVSGTPGTGTMVYRSRDLRDWLEPEVVFLTADHPGLWATRGAWAPEVHEYQGRYYLFTTLHDETKKLPIPPPNQYGTPFQLPNYMRGTIVAGSDSLLGPFVPLDTSRPTPPENFMTLDGTLYVDRDGQPWMVYAHEWLQRIDGTIEAIRLTDDLSGTVGDPIFLCKGSDAFWLTEQIPGGVPHQLTPYVTDGPQLYHLPRGRRRNDRRRLRADVRPLAFRPAAGTVGATPSGRQRRLRARHAVPHVRRAADDGAAQAVQQRPRQALRRRPHTTRPASATPAHRPRRWRLKD
jgi:hypothetical protein